MRSIRRPSAALVVACLALLVALGGTSYATVLAVPRNSVGPLQLQRNAVGPSKIAPNAIRSGHVLDGSLLTTDFKPGQIPQGPKGDKGDKGSKGDKGAKGDPGLPGVAQYQIVSAASASDPTDVKSAIANCPTGKKALGGGASSSGPTAIFNSHPNGGDPGWIAQARETQATSGNWSVTAYVVCAIVT
jgi:hypothetical protein